MAKTRKIKRRDSGAASLESPLFRHRVIPDKKKVANKRLPRSKVDPTKD